MLSRQCVVDPHGPVAVQNDDSYVVSPSTRQGILDHVFSSRTVWMAMVFITMVMQIQVMIMAMEQRAEQQSFIVIFGCLFNPPLGLLYLDDCGCGVVGLMEFLEIRIFAKPTMQSWTRKTYKDQTMKWQLNAERMNFKWEGDEPQYPHPHSKLLVAIKRNLPSTVERILKGEYVGNCHFMSNDMTPECLRVCLSVMKGSRILEVDSFCFAIFYLVRNGCRFEEKDRVTMFRMLFEADPFGKETCLLHECKRPEPNPEIIHLLLEAGTNLNFDWDCLRKSVVIQEWLATRKLNVLFCGKRYRKTSPLSMLPDDLLEMIALELKII